MQRMMRSPTARVGRGNGMEQGTHDEMLGRLAEAVWSVTAAHPTRVAIDGPPAAGKTTLADCIPTVIAPPPAREPTPEGPTSHGKRTSRQKYRVVRYGGERPDARTELPTQDKGLGVSTVGAPHRECGRIDVQPYGQRRRPCGCGRLPTTDIRPCHCGTNRPDECGRKTTDGHSPSEDH